MSDAIVKNLNFGTKLEIMYLKVLKNSHKLLAPHLGASGKCVMLEDHTGNQL